MRRQAIAGSRHDARLPNSRRREAHWHRRFSYASPLATHEFLVLEFAGQLKGTIETDRRHAEVGGARAERGRGGPACGTVTDRVVEGFLERRPLFGHPPPDHREGVVVEGDGGPHVDSIASQILTA